MFAVIVSSCSHFTKSLYEETDKVMKSNRVMYESSFKANKRYKQIYWQKLLFQKETDRYQNVKYTLYDVVSVPLESYNLKDTMYIVVDKDIIPVKITFNEQFNSRKINEHNEEILQSDSTKKTVVTGYDMVNLKTFQMTHTLNKELIDKLRNARELNLRYYAGPKNITTEIKGGKLRKIKQWIEK